MSVITAMTAQNTVGVRAVQESTPEFLKMQLDAVFEDIYPDAVKIGMVSSSELICVIADRLKNYGAKKIVVDPVMVASVDSSLITATQQAYPDFYCFVCFVCSYCRLIILSCYFFLI